MENRIAIITGASSGIGRATARRLAERGVRMVLNARNAEKLDELTAYINNGKAPARAVAVAGDVSDPGVTERCIEAALNAWQQAPAIFIASAGRGLPGTLISSRPEDWDELINTNVKGLMYQLSSVGKCMSSLQEKKSDYVSEPADIIVIGSSIGRNVSPFNSVYGATKFAAHGLTEALSRELGPKGIRVTLIEPGLVKTNFQEASGYDPVWFGKYEQEVGPVLTGDDIAGVIDYVLGLPGNVHVDNISIRPTRQAYP